MKRDYSHLNTTCPLIIVRDGVTLEITDMSELARAVCISNYGLHRFLSEVIKVENELDSKHDRYQSSLVESVRESLDRGDF